MGFIQSHGHQTKEERPLVDENFSLPDLHLSAESLESTDMEVDRPSTNIATARQRDHGFALSAKKSPDHEEASPQFPHSLRTGLAGRYVARIYHNAPRRGGAPDADPYRL